jgi:hypothetical protein
VMCKSYLNGGSYEAFGGDRMDDEYVSVKTACAHQNEE